jgi:CRISPR-associated endoribonuclease Cas6
MSVPLRIILKLTSSGQFSANFDYHHAVQGFIYSTLNNPSSPFYDLHDKKTYKFFCFSNIFSSRDKMLNLIISSPNDELIEEITNRLSPLAETQSTIQIGDTQYKLQKIIVFSYKNLLFPLKLVTATPILLRIPHKKLSHQQGANSLPYNDVYWRNNYPMELFIEGIESNLDKKYKDCTMLSVKKNIDDSLFAEYRFKKQVSTKIHLHNTHVPVIGSLWELGFSYNIDKSVQIFALDCGLGERNSLGFGFVNELNN